MRAPCPTPPPAADPENIPLGLADAVNRQSAIVRCGVNSRARQIVCMVPAGITTASANRIADHLAAVAHGRGIPGAWAAITAHQEW